jgi:hypothetical protein
MERTCTYHISTQLTPQEHRWPYQILWYARPAQRNPALHIRSLLLIRQILFIELRPYRARQQCITPDVILPQCTCARLDQGEHPSFRGGVVHLLGSSDEGTDGGDTDYGTAGGRLDGELGSGGLDGVECAGEVCVQGLGPEDRCDTAHAI